MAYIDNFNNSSVAQTKKNKGNLYIYYLDMQARNSGLRRDEVVAHLDTWDKHYQAFSLNERENLRAEYQQALSKGYTVRPVCYSYLRTLSERNQSQKQLPRSQKGVGSANRVDIPNTRKNWMQRRASDIRAMLDRWSINFVPNPMVILNEHFSVVVVSEQPNLHKSDLEVAYILFSLRGGILNTLTKRYEANDQHMLKLLSVYDDLQLMFNKCIVKLDIFTPSMNFVNCEKNLKRVQAAKYPHNSSISVKVMCLEDLILAITSWMDRHHQTSMVKERCQLIKKREKSLANFFCKHHTANRPNHKVADICALQWAVYSVCKIFSVLGRVYPDLPLCENPAYFVQRKSFKKAADTINTAK